MATITTKHTLGGYEIVRLLCRFHGVHVEGPDPFRGTPGDTLSRRLIEKAVRRAVKDWGVDAYLFESWDEDYTAWAAALIVAWAAAQIRRLYPELVDDQLIGFEAEYPMPEPEEKQDRS